MCAENKTFRTAPHLPSPIWRENAVIWEPARTMDGTDVGLLVGFPSGRIARLFRFYVRIAGHDYRRRSFHGPTSKKTLRRRIGLAVRSKASASN